MNEQEAGPSPGANLNGRASSGSSPSAPPVTHHRRRLTRSQLRRGTYALLGIAVVLLIGTIGFHAIAGLGWVDSFYFESMLATGQGPPLTLTSDASKLFASLMAFVSVGSVISAILLTLGPIILQLWRETVELVEREARELERDVRGQGPRR